MKRVTVIAPQAIKDNTEFVGSKGSTPVVVDTKEWDYVEFIVVLGAKHV